MPALPYPRSALRPQRINGSYKILKHLWASARAALCSKLRRICKCFNVRATSPFDCNATCFAVFLSSGIVDRRYTGDDEQARLFVTPYIKVVQDQSS